MSYKMIQDLPPAGISGGKERVRRDVVRCFGNCLNFINSYLECLHMQRNVWNFYPSYVLKILKLAVFFKSRDLLKCLTRKNQEAFLYFEDT